MTKWKLINNVLHLYFPYTNWNAGDDGQMLIWQGMILNGWQFSYQFSFIAFVAGFICTGKRKKNAKNKSYPLCPNQEILIRRIFYIFSRIIWQIPWNDISKVCVVMANKALLCSWKYFYYDRRGKYSWSKIRVCTSPSSSFLVYLDK